MILLRQEAAAKEMASTSATSARMTCGRRFALLQVQPALSQIVSLAGGGGENIEKRRWNKQVQGFELVLDFSRSRASARLSYGFYVIVGDCSGSECITVELGPLVLRFQQHENRQ